MMVVDPSPKPAERVAQERRRRLIGLDGMRGLAALAVVFHHCYLLAFPGYPRMAGPWWAAWLTYGHFAVVIFIVLSGFSLAVSPARSGWRLGGKTKFARRRAWRILPPYWAALVFSLAIAWTVIPQPGELAPTAKSVVVNGLLLQDITGAPTPNGAFWSIAVEAQLYVVFPLMLLLLRRGSTAVMLSCVGTVVALIGILAPSRPAVAELLRLTPQFAVLFAMGAAAAGVLAAADWRMRVPWAWLAAIVAAPTVLLIVREGSVWTVAHFFWVDILLGTAVALLLAAAGNGRPAPLLRVLNTRPLRSLGSFSYSLYLIHAPIVVVVYAKVVAPRYAPGVPAFLATAAIAGTISVIGARLFAAVFELPFQRHRSWPALKQAARDRWAAVRLSGQQARAGIRRGFAQLTRPLRRRRDAPSSDPADDLGIEDSSATADTPATGPAVAEAPLMGGAPTVRATATVAAATPKIRAAVAFTDPANARPTVIGTSDALIRGTASVRIPSTVRASVPVAKPATPDGPKPATPDGPKPVTADGPKPVTADGPKPAMPNGPKPVTPNGLRPATPNWPAPATPDGPKPATAGRPMPAARRRTESGSSGPADAGGRPDHPGHGGGESRDVGSRVCAGNPPRRL